MSQFVVSARKYRPMRFIDVVGQQQVSGTLKKAIQNDQVAQAFLFCGPRGVGKTTCARILAKVLNCEQPTEDFEPCNTCPSCAAFNKNSSLNIHELDAASNNSVEHIRALVEQVRFPPQRGRYKIYIIDEVHMLSNAAFNAFLKTLEEPPAYAVFILATTEKHKIIPTILSRCQIFDFNRIQVRDIVVHLQHICETEHIEADDTALNIIAQKADGALRDALSIFDRIVSFSGKTIRYADVVENLNILDYDYYFKITEAVVAEDNRALLLLYDEILRKGFDGEVFVTGLAEHFRSLLVCKDEATHSLLEVTGQIKTRYIEHAARIPSPLIFSALNILNTCDIHYKTARNKRLHVEMALIKMAHILQATQIAQQPQPQTVEKKNTNSESLTPSTNTTQTPPQKPIQQLTQNLKAKLKKTSTQNSQKSSLLEKMKQAAQQELEQANAPKTPLTLEALQAQWRLQVEQVESDSTRAILTRFTEKIVLSGLEIQLTVDSTFAKSSIIQEAQLLQNIRNHFGEPTLALTIQVDKTQQQNTQNTAAATKPKKLTLRDKYRFLLEKNALLKEVQKRFELFPER